MLNFIYVDNSNVWIAGQRLAAVKNGMASDLGEAFDQQIVDPDWRYDFDQFLELLAPDPEQIGRSMLFGSTPPETDTLWESARQKGFEVKTYRRDTRNREKQVDTAITAQVVSDVHEYMRERKPDVRLIIVSGDADFVPPIEVARDNGISTRVVSWEHSVARRLREAANEFVALDSDFDRITIR